MELYLSINVQLFQLTHQNTDFSRQTFHHLTKARLNNTKENFCTYKQDLFISTCLIYENYKKNHLIICLSGILPLVAIAYSQHSPNTTTQAFTSLMTEAILRAAEVQMAARCALRQTKELAEDAVLRERIEEKSAMNHLKSLIKMPLHLFDSVINTPQASTRRH